MKRRKFLSGTLMGIIGVIAGLSQWRCKSPMSPSDPNEEKTFRSSYDDGHTHTITIKKTEIQNPPASGISRSTSSDSYHSHTFTMSQAELQMVNSGVSVSVKTGVSSGHTHTFTVTKWF